MTKAVQDIKTGQSIPALEIGTVQTITTSGSSAATSSAFGETSLIVRVVCTEDANITFGASPTATTSSTFLPANQVEYFKVPVPGTSKLAAIQNSAAGTLYVTEMG
jgi:hypothetical protein